MKKIAFCGSYGTSKSALAKLLAEKLSISLITGINQGYWRSIGIDNFEALPESVLTVCQKHLLLNQIRHEDLQEFDWVSDRSVIDFAAYNRVSSDMCGVDIIVYEELIKARLRNYTHVVYFPLQFDFESEEIISDYEIQEKIDTLIICNLQIWLPESNYLTVSGSVEEKLDLICNFVS